MWLKSIFVADFHPQQCIVLLLCILHSGNTTVLLLKAIDISYEIVITFN